jgi:hypothetical protein
MKDIVYFYIELTTLVLVMVTIMATMNFPFNWVFYTTVLGQALVIFMVYKVLSGLPNKNGTNFLGRIVDNLF